MHLFDYSRSMTTNDQIIMDSVRRIVQALRRSSVRTEQVSSITGAQALALRHVGRQAGLSINELAGLTCTHQSTVSEVVGRLEALGLLSRTRAQDDGRRVELHLTEAGRDLATALEPTIQEDLMSALMRLPSQTREELGRGLTAWIVEAGLNEAPVVMFFEPETQQPKTPVA
ncbi:MarR family winged helix-turn-helix transcriptional regulator [Wenxinia marina]|uniref:Transcriptional regulator n=1 Tax=Wenxinia marina DSM 24838 TaxID=1123501 RepID=A0A0D0QGU9_9RHOB|nr:MarR family winged helix-turn-helix transcriptional regulator [Wenxinia marina]KIQ70208.1 Transcriptional regulator [Wenxinia marina DSM 24838]GGL50479.1 MarR family transcriptional regulator [Wenxinia marina]